MRLTYYNNKSDKRYVDKTIEQIVAPTGSQNPVQCDILDDSSLAKPTFKVHDFEVSMTANYLYLDELRRYYFIDDITMSKGYAYLKCTCDVLSTYKNGLRQQHCIIKRQKNKFNLYQNDPQTKILNYEALKIAEFPDGFDSSKQVFILGCMGSTSNPS